MLSFIKPVPVYIKLYTNKIEVTRLDTGQTITREAVEKFSSTRLVIADFHRAEGLVRSIIKEFGKSRSLLQPSFRMVIQQMEKTEGGLSVVELRAIKDLGEHAGGMDVRIVEKENPLTIAQALLELEKRKR